MGFHGTQPLKIETMKLCVQCPVCRERGVINQADVSTEHECPNCRRVVVMEPENSRHRMVRLALHFAAGVVLFLIVLWMLSREFAG